MAPRLVDKRQVTLREFLDSRKQVKARDVQSCWTPFDSGSPKCTLYAIHGCTAFADSLPVTHFWFSSNRVPVLEKYSPAVTRVSQSSREYGGLAQPVSHPSSTTTQTPPKTLVRRVLLFSETMRVVLSYPPKVAFNESGYHGIRPSLGNIHGSAGQHPIVNTKHRRTQHHHEFD